MSYKRFDEHFWGPNGPEVIEKRLNQGTESNKYFSYFLEERANIEESLAKLLKTTANLVEFGTMRDCWLAVRGETENLVKLHHDLSVSLHKELGSPLTRFKDEQTKMRRQYLTEVAKLNTERKLLEKNIQKLREKYEDYARKAEQSQQKVEQAKQQNKPPNDLAKLSQGAQQEEERIDYTKGIFQKYAQSLEVSAPFYGESWRRLADITKRIDKNEDIMCFIRENQTGTEKPSVPSFVKAGGGPSISSPGYNPPSYSSSASSFSSSSTPSYNPPSYSSAPKSTPASKPANGKSKAGRKVRALYDYVGADASELDFFAGDTITVLEEDDSGWWMGELDGRKGVFPSNYAE